MFVRNIMPCFYEYLIYRDGQFIDRLHHEQIFPSDFHPSVNDLLIHDSFPLQNAGTKACKLVVISRTFTLSTPNRPIFDDKMRRYAMACMVSLEEV